MWQALDPGFPLAVAVAAGWLWGSFLNQVVDRTPRRGLATPTITAKGVPHPSLLRPARSFCFSCGAPIAWFDNLPVFSYLWLGGRCRACRAVIGPRTLVMEIVTPLAFALLYQGARTEDWELAPALWGAGLMSWLLVFATLALEKRRFGLVFLALGLVLATGMAQTAPVVQ